MLACVWYTELTCTPYSGLRLTLWVRSSALVCVCVCVCVSMHVCDQFSYDAAHPVVRDHESKIK